ncbi:DUF2306 domain-containing protein [Haloferula sp. BvORR071]|uniref:DUF2306 domain-containing protein n=1 Tax=Haloferula sp. BvORR071 TaxID=1396141 RepID=UPI0006980036|nr:DUF2306 domain-containing protein [Haloferula sp. BvORR071]
MLNSAHAKKRSPVKTAGGVLLLLALAFFSVLMARITAEYWPVRNDAAFLQIKQQYLGIKHWEFAFWTHVFTSMIPLLAGFTQFMPAVLSRWPKLHRAVGKTYVIAVLFVTGPASLVMAFYANGGITSRIAFTLLALLWLSTTAMAWRTALQRQWTKHRDWMIRSYALTLSAITLRAWKYLIVLAFEPRPMDVYRIVAWLGFIPNLLLAEWLVRSYRKKKARVVEAVREEPSQQPT